MKFSYQAKTKQGELQVGAVEAANREAAISILGGHELFILSLKESSRPHWWDNVASYLGRVRTHHVMIFARQLATLLQARLPLNNALRILEEQTTHPVLREAVHQIAEDVSAGLSFSQALARQNKIFSNFFISMIQSAEVIGNLEDAAGFLADYMEKENILSTKARSALIYPAVVIALFGVVGFIMITVVFPQIGPVFEQSGVALPWYTQALLGSGRFLGKWWVVILFALGIGLIGFLNYMQTREGRALFDDFKVRFPLIKKLFIPLTVTRLSNVMSMLLKGGVPVTQAVQIAGLTVNNVIYEDIMNKVAQDVQEGKPLSVAFSGYPEYFPPLASQMLVVGEATGQIDTMLARLSGFYGRQVDTVVGNLVDLIQPALMIVIGTMVGLLFASILVPLYQLTSSIQ